MVLELELVGVIKETKKNTFKLVKNKHEKEETIDSKDEREVCQ